MKDENYFIEKFISYSELLFVIRRFFSVIGRYRWEKNSSKHARIFHSFFDGNQRKYYNLNRTWSISTFLKAIDSNFLMDDLLTRVDLIEDALLSMKTYYEYHWSRQVNVSRFVEAKLGSNDRVSSELQTRFHEQIGTLYYSELLIFLFIVRIWFSVSIVRMQLIGFYDINENAYNIVQRSIFEVFILMARSIQIFCVQRLNCSFRSTENTTYVTCI